MKIILLSFLLIQGFSNLSYSQKIDSLKIETVEYFDTTLINIESQLILKTTFIKQELLLVPKRNKFIANNNIISEVRYTELCQLKKCEIIDSINRIHIEKLKIQKESIDSLLSYFINTKSGMLQSFTMDFTAHKKKKIHIKFYLQNKIIEYETALGVSNYSIWSEIGNINRMDLNNILIDNLFKKIISKKIVEFDNTN